jgi:hypothetical protein
MTAIASARFIGTDHAQRHRAQRMWWLNYASVLGLTVVIAGVALATAATFFSVAVLILFGLLAAIFRRPERALWIVAFFAVAGDSVTAPWYPFAKNFSSHESLLFVANALILNPVEVCLGAAFAGWMFRMASTRRWEFRRTLLSRPMLIFGAFILLGLVYGIGRGGNSNVALWEARPLVYLVAIYVLATNLLSEPKHYRRLWTAIMAAVVVDSVLGIIYYRGLDAIQKSKLEQLGEHSAAVHANAYFVMIAAMWVMKARSPARMIIMLALFPVVGYAYILGQRRSAFVGLGLAAIMLAAMLYRFRRRAFWCVIPVASILFVGYTGAMWNSTGSAAFPAQAVKTIVAPGQLSAKDQSSDIYRQIETFDIVYTIKAHPLTGIGFGQKFSRPLPLPDISFFIWQAYITHNSIHWIWMNMGIGGFLSMLYLFGSSIRVGTRRLTQSPMGLDAALLLTSLLFVVMYAIYAYVDIAWDTQSNVILAIALAHIGGVTVAKKSARDRPELVDETTLSERQAVPA